MTSATALYKYNKKKTSKSYTNYNKGEERLHCEVLRLADLKDGEDFDK